MRYVLIGLGIITIVLAVVLAWEGQWWAAIPDGFFGAGIPWMAWNSLREDQHQRQMEKVPTPEPEPEPVAVAATPAVAEPASAPPPSPAALPPPAPVSPPGRPRQGPHPARSHRKKHKRR